MQHAEDAADTLIGRVIDGRYRVEAQLGEGGLGVVYRATQARLERPVALKVLHAEHAARPALRARFEREARSLGALQHPNIVTVIDYGFDGALPFLVMELLEGLPLDAALRQGLSHAEAVAACRGLLSALAYAHARGVVHRDLKPGNIFLQRVHEGGTVCRVLDFGLAKFLEAEREGEAPLTRAGAILGTPAYMSPEQATGGSINERADVYSLGIVLYELFAGERPFRGSAADLLRMHISDELPSLSARRPDLPSAEPLEQLLRRATDKRPQRRYADGGELLAAFEAIFGRASGALPVPPSAAQDVTRVASRRAEAEAPTVIPSATRAERRGGPARGAQPGPKPALLALAGLVVLGVAGGAAALLTRDEAESSARAAAPQLASAAAPEAPLAAPAAPLAAPTAPPEATEAQVAPAPQEAQEATVVGLGPALEALLAAHRPGSLPSRAEFGRIFDHARAAPDDPRPYLVLGYVYFDGGGRTDALRFFREALERDPAVRADPRMLREVSIMSAHRSVGRAASALLREVWGADALPTLDALLHEGSLDDAETTRLERLRASLAP